MRLLCQDQDGLFKLTSDLTREELPEYGILSHTWLLNNDAEITFEDMIQGNIHSKPEGYAKLEFCAQQAAKDGLKYFWLDTCCINKQSSADLQEAITTMFAWYRDAVRCYVYLTDVSVDQSVIHDPVEQSLTDAWQSQLRQSRWFTRGWTLQELLAPRSVEFFSKEGTKLGDKMSLMQIIHEITGIPGEALRGDKMSDFSVEERFSWAAKRRTKRSEDGAYCLLGIFNVFMTLLYGEEGNAFQRLRREIDRKHEELANLDHLLSMLPVTTEAAFNSLQNQHEPTCLANTRTEIIQTITTWIDGNSESHIFWLKGIAGTGKSTVARTIARAYHDRGILGGSFFFSKDAEELTKANKLVTTLARQLANRVPDAKRHICEAIAKQEDIIEHSIQDQWNQLIIGPLGKLASRSPSLILLLVIDALDECESENDVRVIIKALGSGVPLSNVRLRIFITTRPQTAIRSSFNRIPDAAREGFVLHEIPNDLIGRDLSIYFEANFTMIREERGFENNWPSIWVVKKLVEISCGLFIWAATACRFISSGKRLNKTITRINNLISGSSSRDGPERQLDRMYTTVIQEFVQQEIVDEEDREETYKALREVLGGIVILCSPLSTGSLARLLGIPLRDVQDTLLDLQTVFNVPDEESHPVRVHHPTFREFLLSKERCTDSHLWVDEKQRHKELGDSCIALMSRMLKANICDLESPGILVEDLDPALIQRSIPPDLQYACVYWAEHYRRSGIRLSDGDSVDIFLRKFFLYWLEAINTMGKSAEMGAIMRLYHSLLMPDLNERQIPFIKDARRMIFNFQNIIKRAPLQTYCASLAFIPATNELKMHFLSQQHPWIRDIRIAGADIPKAKDDFNYVSDLSFTPDGTIIASGSNFPAARSWNIATRAIHRKFEANLLDKMSSVAISPDGKLLAGGSDDFTVMAWNISTGTLEYRIKFHTGWVNSVFFSPNGKLLVSGAMDNKIALWDAATGQEIRIIDNQSSCVNSAAFSPDGLFIATGSVDATVRLWEASKDSKDIYMLLDGHTSPINSVRFSPKGKLLVSGSDDTTIKLWDIATGAEVMTLRGHTKKVMAVTFSMDACLVASGSEDKTVQIWDANNGTLLSTLEDHTSGINSVIFSPDDTLLVSSSFDDEVRLWDTKTWAPLGKLEDFEEDIHSGTLATQRSYDPTSVDLTDRIKEIKGHSKAITCIVTALNGPLFASGSQDSTIKLWQAGEERWLLKGHSDTVNDLAFSPDGSLLASASADQTVRLWNPTTGATIHTFRGHSADVLCVAFSSDSRLLGSFSTDNTVFLWEAATGKKMCKLEGHSNTIRGITFSPDNCSLMSWSVDKTALIWSVSTCTLVATLGNHVGSVNYAAFSAEGNLLASCSDDSIIQVWSEDGTRCGEIPSGTLPVTCIAFSPDSQLLASCATDGIVKIWDVQTKTLKGSLDATMAIRAMSFSECAKYIETDRGVLDVSAFSSCSAPSVPALAPSHAVFVTKDWVRRGTKNAIWLPTEYQATHVAVHHDTVVLGHSSGSVTFIRLV